MRRGELLYWLAATLIGTLLVPTAWAQYEDIVARAKSTVVLIVNETSQGTVTGTGFLFDSNGYIATSRYIVEDANRLTVLTAEGKRLPAWVARHRNDFTAAIIKVPGPDFPTLPLGDSDSVRRRQEILVLGYPFLGPAPIQFIPQVTATIGIFDLQIRTNVELDPGNNGGPVLNDRGEVIAIVSTPLDIFQEQRSKWKFKVDINQFRAFAVDVSPDAIAAPRRALKSTQPQLHDPFVDPAHGIFYFCDPDRHCKTWPLDANLAAFILTYGPARVTSAPVSGYKNFCWEDREPAWCVIVAVDSSRLVAVTVSGSSFQIVPARSGGLIPQIGDPESRVITAMGEPEFLWQRPDTGTHWLVYDVRGVAAVIDNRRGILTGVSLFQPGTARSFMAIR